MGLAASQVRMLSLTSRRASIERDMLRDSNRKVALSREMNNLANEYYDALSAERLMYLSDAGEYRNLSYQYLMGRPGGIEDIDVKSDNSMLLIDTLSGKVVLDDKMAQAIYYSQEQLASSAQNIYLAVARLCGDTNITTPEGFPNTTFVISPNLVRDICAGKYDSFSVEDLTNAIKNKEMNNIDNNYLLWTYDPEWVTTTTVSYQNDMGINTATSYTPEIAAALARLGSDFEYAYNHNETVAIGYSRDVENDGITGSYPSQATFDGIVDVIAAATRVACAYFNVNSFDELNVNQRLALRKVLFSYSINYSGAGGLDAPPEYVQMISSGGPTLSTNDQNQETEMPSGASSRNFLDTIAEPDYVHVYNPRYTATGCDSSYSQPVEDHMDNIYLDARLFLNALYAAYKAGANAISSNTDLYHAFSNDTTVFNPFYYNTQSDEPIASLPNTTYKAMFSESMGDSTSNGDLVLIGKTREYGLQNYTKMVQKFYKTWADAHFTNLSEDAQAYVDKIIRRLSEPQFDISVNPTGTPTYAPAEGNNHGTNNVDPENLGNTISANDLIANYFMISDTDKDKDRLMVYYAHGSDGYNYLYADTTALMSFFIAALLGEDAGYQDKKDVGPYNATDNPHGLIPTFWSSAKCYNIELSNAESENSGSSSYDNALGLPMLTSSDIEVLTVLNRNLYSVSDSYYGQYETLNPNRQNLLNSSTVVQTTTYLQEDAHVWHGNNNNGQQFVPAGEVETQWIQNFKDLIKDVKFYYTIVTACAKFGYTTDYAANLDDSEYLDKNIQNGIFQLMGFETDVFSLNSAKDTDYYLLTSEFSKMNDPAQQAIITAWYESEKAEINAKETYLDTQIENLSVELNSIKTEIESVKTLIDDAVKQNFDWGKG